MSSRRAERAMRQGSKRTAPRPFLSLSKGAGSVHKSPARGLPRGRHQNRLADYLRKER